MTVSDAREIPLDAVFGDAASRVFPAIRDALADEARDPRDRDAFLMARPAVELLRELRPEEGVGLRMAELQALVHHAYLCWARGRRTVGISTAATIALLAGTVDPHTAAAYDGAHYAQFPPRLLWARFEDGAPFEPLDGCFVSSLGAELAVLGIFGFHPERAALTAAEAVGVAPTWPTRADGSEPFAPLMDGGARAGLHSLASPEELLFLGAATISAAGASSR